MVLMLYLMRFSSGLAMARAMDWRKLLSPA